MKRIYELIKYQLRVYFKGSSCIMPLVMTALFLYVMYSVKPVGIVSSSLLTCSFLFLLAVWIGMSVSLAEHDVSEQILLLRVEKESDYYIGKILFLLSITCLANLLCTVFPVVQNLLNGGTLFSRPMYFSDIGNAFLLQGGCAFAGASFGSFLHPRVMKDGKMAIALTVLFTVVSFTKTALTELFPLTKAVLWIVPPAMLPAEKYGNAEYFNMVQTLGIFLVLVCYSVVYGIVKSLLCSRNKF